MKKIICILMIFSFILNFSACSNDKDDEVSFIEHDCDGLILTLPYDYIESSDDRYSFYYSNANSICIGSREAKKDISDAGIVLENLTQYTATIIHSIDPSIQTNEYNNGYCFEWTKNINDTDYSYLGFTIDSGDAYYLIQFATLKSEYENLRETFLSYIDNIKIGA